MEKSVESKVLEKVINGETYKYIEYKKEGDLPLTSVDGMVIILDEETKCKLSGFGGFYRDLMSPLLGVESDSIVRLVALSSTTPGMNQLTGFFFETDTEKMMVSWTAEPRIVEHIYRRILKEDVSISVINSLDFLEDLDESNSKFSKILDNYYSPLCVDDTGLYIDGVMINYGDQLVIKKLQQAIENNPRLRSKNILRMKVDSIELTVNENGIGTNGIIGSGISKKKCGSTISSIESYYYNFVSNETSTASDYLKFLKENHDETIEHLEEKKERMIKDNRMPEEEILTKISEEYKKGVLEDNETSVELIGLGFLLECIKDGLVKFSK